MSRRSPAAIARAALSRSYRAERVLVFLIGLLLLAGGAFVVVVGQGWLGRFRAERPLLDPLAVDLLRAQPVISTIVAVVLGLLLIGIGLKFFLRTLRPERHPNMVLENGTAHRLTINSSALANAVGADCAAVDGVSRARAQLVGNTANPALRLHVWLREGSDLRAVWQEIESTVLSRARDSLGVSTLPTAVRVELDAAQRQRVR